MNWAVDHKPLDEIDGAFGLCHYTKGLIEIGSDMPEFTKKGVLLHEILHALLYHQGHQTFGNPTEEKYVNAIATGLTGILQDNPAFAQWLIAPITS